MVPKVDTFARDISDEIKHKEASLADIVTASNDVGNTDTTPMENKSSRMFAIAIVFLGIGIMGLVGFIYYYFVSLSKPSVVIQEPVVTETQTKKTSSLSSLSVSLNSNIGLHVSSVTKNGSGYVLALSSYSPVFAYMTRNESDYIDELLESVNDKTLESKAKVKGTTTDATTTTEQVTRATSTGSGTPPMSTTTVASSSAEDSNNVSPWSDITISNTNMRVYTKDGKSVVYSFISTDKLVIAKTKEDILTIKNAILR